MREELERLNIYTYDKRGRVESRFARRAIKPRWGGTGSENGGFGLGGFSGGTTNNGDEDENPGFVGNYSDEDDPNSPNEDRDPSGGDDGSGNGDGTFTIDYDPVQVTELEDHPDKEYEGWDFSQLNSDPLSVGNVFDSDGNPISTEWTQEYTWDHEDQEFGAVNEWSQIGNLNNNIVANRHEASILGFELGYDVYTFTNTYTGATYETNMISEILGEVLGFRPENIMKLSVGLDAITSIASISLPGIAISYALTGAINIKLSNPMDTIKGLLNAPDMIKANPVIGAISVGLMTLSVKDKINTFSSLKDFNSVLGDEGVGMLGVGSAIDSAGRGENYGESRLDLIKIKQQAIEKLEEIEREAEESLKVALQNGAMREASERSRGKKRSGGSSDGVDVQNFELAGTLFWNEVFAGGRLFSPQNSFMTDKMMGREDRNRNSFHRQVSFRGAGMAGTSNFRKASVHNFGYIEKYLN